MSIRSIFKSMSNTIKKYACILPESPQQNKFLKEMYVTNYSLTSDQEMESYQELKEDQLVMPLKFMLGLSRRFDMGKDLLWNLQKKYFLSQNDQLITRNNVMRSDSAF